MKIYNYTQFNENKNLPHFQIFGSENSKDYDVIVFVDNIPEVIDDAHTLCKKYNAELLEILDDKPLNCNLGVVKDGHIVDVFKGTPDEVNNALYYTYDYHKQYYPNAVKSLVNRDSDMKILRASRGILSFFSRSEMRAEIKKALRGDLREKIPVLKKLDFTKMTDFPGKKEAVDDIYKVISFQFGQLFSLIDGHEPDSYSKNGIIKNYPDLEPMLNRRKLGEKEMETLNIYKDRLIDLIEDRIDKMATLVE